MTRMRNVAGLRKVVPSWNRRGGRAIKLEAQLVVENDHPVCAFKGGFAAFS